MMLLYNLLYSLSVHICSTHMYLCTRKLFVDLISLKVCEMCFYQYVPLLLPTPLLALRSTAVPWAATSVKVLAAMWRLSHGVAIVSTLKPFILLLPLYNDEDDGCVVLCSSVSKLKKSKSERMKSDVFVYTSTTTSTKLKLATGLPRY